AVSSEGFAYLTHALYAAAAEVCDGRLLLCLEGGYNLTGLKEGILACLLELQRKSPLTPKKLAQLAGAPAPAGIFRQVQNIANHYWKL
ncbi:MAG: histone deacetylase, partial [Deltaproteobacteria bacterium]